MGAAPLRASSGSAVAGRLGGFVSAGWPLLVAILFVPAFLLVPSYRGGPESTDSWEIASIERCGTDTIRLIKPDKVDHGTLFRTLDYCYARQYYQATLSEMAIRRSGFLRQNHENEVMLWMVVTITVSGVFLAGMQLLASYNLAQAGRGEFAGAGEVTLERGRLAVKSSVTGLLILSVSFAFFMVYVLFVYTIKEHQPASSPGAGQATQGAAAPVTAAPDGPASGPRLTGGGGPGRAKPPAPNAAPGSEPNAAPDGAEPRPPQP
jgi:hypothetical protein